MATQPSGIQHPFVDPCATGACEQRIDDVVCALSNEHACHVWPFAPLPEASSTSAVVAQGACEPESAGQRVADLEELLESLWLYTSWRYTTRQLTTDQKDLWADIVDARHEAQDREEGLLGTDLAYSPVDRWWRN